MLHPVLIYSLAGANTKGVFPGKFKGGNDYTNQHGNGKVNER